MNTPKFEENKIKPIFHLQIPSTDQLLLLRSFLVCFYTVPSILWIYIELCYWCFFRFARITKKSTNERGEISLFSTHCLLSSLCTVLYNRDFLWDVSIRSSRKIQLPLRVQNTQGGKWYSLQHIFIFTSTIC